jgi:hypothetical protein
VGRARERVGEPRAETHGRAWARDTVVGAVSDTETDAACEVSGRPPEYSRAATPGERAR